MVVCFCAKTNNFKHFDWFGICNQSTTTLKIEKMVFGGLEVFF
jgi:hypothetical protein